MSFLPSSTKKDRSSTAMLDLCFVSGEEAEPIRALWQLVPADAAEAGFDDICRVLWLCTERPMALSIAHADTQQPVLPVILAYMQHANGILSAATDHAEGAGPLPWRECGAGVAVIHAAATLFAHLSSTPQYRLLLLQHDVPAHARHTISRLADGLQAVGGGNLGSGALPSMPPTPSRASRRSQEHPRDSPSGSAEPQALALLHTLQLCTQLLGCVWQAGFAALHTAELLRVPNPPRLPDSVEELLGAPAAGLGLIASDAAGGGGGWGAGSSASSSSAAGYLACADGVGSCVSSSSCGMSISAASRGSSSATGAGTVPLPVREHVAQLLRLVRLAHTQREDAQLGSAIWVTAVRLQRLSAAVLGVLLHAAGPSGERVLLQAHGVSTLLLCMHPHAHESHEYRAPDPSDVPDLGAAESVIPSLATATLTEPAPFHRQLLAMQLQCLLVALLGCAPPEAVAWRAQWTDAGGTFLLARLVRRARLLFRASSLSAAADQQRVVPSSIRGAAAHSANAGSDNVASTSSIAAAAERVLSLTANEASAWCAGMSASALSDWWQGVQPPPTPTSDSARIEAPADELPLEPPTLAGVAEAAERAAASQLPELLVVFSFLRTVCAHCAARVIGPSAGKGAPGLEKESSMGSDDASMAFEFLSARGAATDEASEAQESILTAVIEASMPHGLAFGSFSNEAALVAVDSGGPTADRSAAPNEVALILEEEAGDNDGVRRDEGEQLFGAASGAQLHVLRILREFSTSVVLPSTSLAPRAVRLLCSTQFVRSGAAVRAATWPVDIAVPPPIDVPACALSEDGEVEQRTGSAGKDVPGRWAITRLSPLAALAVGHLRALVASPWLQLEAAAACASTLLAAVEAERNTLRDLRTQFDEAAHDETRARVAAAAECSLHTLRALWLCFCELMASLVQRAPPQPPLPLEPAGQMPTEWNHVLVHLSTLLASIRRKAPSSLPPQPQQAHDSTVSARALQLELNSMICQACEVALAVPLLSRWALQQMDGNGSLFAALVDLLRACATQPDQPEAILVPSQLARFALRHVVTLLRDAALECRLEGEMQGEARPVDAQSDTLPAWAIAVRLYSAYVALLMPSAPAPPALRALLLDGLAVLVHAEAASLRAGAAHAAHPQEAIGAALSQRLLRECGVLGALTAALDAEAVLSGVRFVALLEHVLQVLPALTWGTPPAQGAFFAAVGHERMLQLLRRAGTPTGTPIVMHLFNWFAGSPAQVEHSRLARLPPVARANVADSGAAWDMPAQSVVQVGEVARLLLMLLPHIEVATQCALLERLGALLDASILNRSRCAALRLLREMLQLLAAPLGEPTQRALLRALTPLASHSVSVSELKLLFSLLAQQPTILAEDAEGTCDAGDDDNVATAAASAAAGAGQNVLHAELLSTIASMLRQHGPAASFLFDGHSSGLVLPPLPKLPTTGYTFCAWVRIDSLLPPASARVDERGEVPAAEWSPRLLALRDEQGRGLELLFVRDARASAGGRAAEAAHGTASLQLRTLGASPISAAAVAAGSSFASVHTLDLSFAFKTGRWYHVALVHEGARLFAKAHATLYVDGKAQHAGALKYPTAERLAHGFIGTNYAVPAAAGGAGARHGAAEPAALLAPEQPPQALRGQVGASFLFAEPLDAERVQQLWGLGASYDWAAVERGEAASTTSNAVAGGTATAAEPQVATAPLLLALNPKSRDGDAFPNNAALAAGAEHAPTLAPLAQSMRGGAHGAAAACLSVGSHACVTHTMRDSAHCLGGVQLLFPLLARLPTARADGERPGGGALAGARAEPLLVQVLGLISQMLFDSAAEQHFMLRRHGFAIFVFLLRQLPPAVWSVQAVTACVQLTSCFAASEALHHEAVWLLFGQPRLWIFTSLEVQLEVYDVLLAVVERKPRAFIAPAGSGGGGGAHGAHGEPEPLLSVQALLDMLEVYYWHQPSAGSFARQPLLHAVSGEVIGERPNADGLRRLRAKVLGLLQARGRRPRPSPSFLSLACRPTPPASTPLATHHHTSRARCRRRAGRCSPRPSSHAPTRSASLPRCAHAATRACSSTCSSC